MILISILAKLILFFMAWTTPRTWVPGELVTASMMNIHVRDNMNALKAEIALIQPLLVTLTDGATPALNAALGNVFTLVALGNRTISVPTNPVSGQKIVIMHKASGADRTLALNTGTGGFRFGTDVTALTATTSAKTDYIGAIYNLADNKWDVVAYTKGF